MVSTTIAATQKIESDSRRWRLILTDQNGETLDSSDGTVISMNHTIEASSDTFTIGEIFTQNINIELRRAIDQDPNISFDYEANTAIRIAYGLRDAPGLIHMGTFRVKKVEKVRDRIRLNLKDYLINELSDTYTASTFPSYPVPILDVMQDICSEYMPINYYEPLYILDDEHEGEYCLAYDKADSIIYVLSDVPRYKNGNRVVLTQAEIEYLSGKKVSEALSICAGMLGCSLVKGRDNTLKCIRPSRVPIEITSSRSAAPDFSGKEQQMVGVICKRSDDVHSADKFKDWREDSQHQELPGIYIEFENPLMNETLFKEITQDYLDWFMRPATINCMLGDPRLDPLDIVGFEDVYDEMYETSGNYQMPIMSLSYTFDGGLSCTLLSTANYSYKEDNNG